MTTNQEILEKAIQKAIDAGWGRGEGFADNNWKVVISRNGVGGSELGIATQLEIRFKFPYHSARHSVRQEELIYDRRFAMALWGEQKITDLGPANADGSIHGIDVDTESGWQYHLKQMVIADDPVKYLGENI